MEFFPPDSHAREPLPRGAQPRVASPEGTVALRSALQSLVRTGAAPADVRRVVEVFCEAGRRAGVHPEQLLVTLKAAWRSIPETRGPSRGTREGLLDEIISACIRGFYAPSDLALDDERALSSDGYGRQARAD